MISDSNKVIRGLVKYYFPDFDDEKAEKFLSSFDEALLTIRKSDYPDEVKNKMYEFFIDPIRTFQILQYELIRIEFMLSEYYKENYDKIIEVCNNTTGKDMSVRIKGMKEFIFLLGEYDVYFSYCFLSKYNLDSYSLPEGTLVLLGSEYINQLEQARKKRQGFDLTHFGMAVCEELRVKMFDFFYSGKEATCQDLQKEFGVSDSTAYHNVSIMVKCGIVKTRKNGRTVYYSLNEECIDKLIIALRNLLR